MKTAVHQLISDLLTGKITDVLANQDRYLEIERSQIVEAAEEGYHCESSTKIDGEDYFRKMFDCYCVNQFLGQDKCAKNNCCACGQNSLPYSAIHRVLTCSRCGNEIHEK